MTAAEHGADEGLARLGDIVERFISEQGMQYNEVAERADFSIETLSKIRQGIRVRPVTYRKLERALGWAPGSAATVQAGGQFEVETPPSAEPAPAVPVDPQAAAILTILEGLPERVQREVLARLGERLPPEVRRSA
jgi:transcriptional regulator with XRE-family HTH domain